MHHHLVADDGAGYDRLARFISGNARGFVACGGGAPCAAHVGVYKAFLEAKISFDVEVSARTAAMRQSDVPSQAHCPGK
jgi:NTE family protein